MLRSPLPTPRSQVHFAGACANSHERGNAAARCDAARGASVGRLLKPVTAPAGFDLRLNVGLIGGGGRYEQKAPNWMNLFHSHCVIGRHCAVCRPGV